MLQLLSAPIALKPPSRLGKRKRRKISEIGAKNLKKAPPQPSESTTPPPEGHNLRKTSAKSPASIATKKDTIQTSVPSRPSEKTSIGLGDFRVGDWG